MKSPVPAVATECSSSEADAEELPEATDVAALWLCSALLELWLVSMAEEFNLEGNSLESSKLVSEALRHELGDSDRVEIAGGKK